MDMMLSEWEGTDWAGTTPEPEVRARVAGSVEDFIFRVSGVQSLHYRIPSIREALGVPAIFRSVTLIANTTGILTLEAFRRGKRLPDSERPRLIVRPDPLQVPRNFFRDTAWNLATRGEAWWWVAKRDPLDGSAMSLLCIPPQQVTVREDPRDLRYPVIEWRGRPMPNEDMRQITYVREPGSLRGSGPLQMCGAAISVAVEADEWAANFYADGGQPSTIIRYAGQLGSMAEGFESEEEAARHEAEVLREQWVDKPNNVPRVIDNSIEAVEYASPNAQGAQMLDARTHQVGEAVRMYGIPASLLNWSTSGSSLTYQNVQQELDKFTRTCLWPDYLEGIEQEMSDLLTRSTVARFNLDAFTRADPKTRWETYQLMSGVLGTDEAASIARQQEGLEAGGIEYAPVPLAPPAARPPAIEARIQMRCDGEHVKRVSGVPRVARCNRLLSTTGVFVGRCPRCKKEYPAAA